MSMFIKAIVACHGASNTLFQLHLFLIITSAVHILRSNLYNSKENLCDFITCQCFLKLAKVFSALC